MVLVEGLLDAPAEQDLPNLALVGLLVAQEEIAGDLHGDGRCALCLAALHEVAADGPQDALVVHAAMGVEIGVFSGDEGVLEVVRHLVEGDHVPPLLVDLSQQLAVAVVDLGDGGRLVLAQGLDGGETLAVVPDHPEEHGGSGDDGSAARSARHAAQAHHPAEEACLFLLLLWPLGSARCWGSPLGGSGRALAYGSVCHWARPTARRR